MKMLHRGYFVASRGWSESIGSMVRETLELIRTLSYARFSESRMEAVRKKKLRAVIRNAYSEVPYYRSLLQSAGVRPDDIRSVEDLRHIPISSKEDLRSAGCDRLLSRWVKQASCRKRTTSGSSGRRFTVLISKEEECVLSALHAASLMSVGYSPRDRLAIFGPQWALPNRLYTRLGLYQREVIPLSLPMDARVQRLSAIQPTVLWTWPSVLRSLIQMLDRPLREIANPRILVSGAEVLDEVLKKRIKKEVDAELFNFYGAIEFGRLAWECPSHEGLHVNAGHFIIECLDGDRPVEPGKFGSVVITSLYAYAMPFIRYRLGDQCALLEKKCSCGNLLPLMDHPRGRSDDMVRLPGGRVLSPMRFHQILSECEAVDQWRVIQKQLDSFVLELVLAKDPGSDGLEHIRSQFLEYFDEPVRLEVAVREYLEEDSAKFRTFISEVPHPE
ncbi:MAG: hypothetical protein P8182_17415 [Deltaproteobacteria bacterium]